ncbi:U3 small nucleolar RNA-associated protein 13 [Saitoella coloradoensis]
MSFAKAPSLKTSFKATRTIEPIYTGGKVALAVDDRTLATTLGEDVQITDMTTGERIAEIKGDSDITTLTVTPDGAHLLTCSRSLQLKTYELPSGRLIRSTKAHEAPVIVMDADPTSTLIATGGAEGAVKVWDVDGGFVTHHFKGHGGVVSALKFWGEKGGGKWYLATGSDDCKVRVWDLVKRTCIAVLDSHVSVIRGLDFSEDGKTLISGSRDKVVNVWDMKTFKLTKTIPTYESLETVGYLSAGTLTEDPKEQVIYTGGENGVVRLWSAKTGQEVGKASTPPRPEIGISDIIYHPTTQLFLSVLTDENLIIHSTSDKTLPVLKRIAGHHDEVIDCTYLGENDTHLAIATNSDEVRIINTDGFDTGALHGHKDIVICLDRDFEGGWLATGAKDNEARLWRIDLNNADPEKRFECFATFTGHAESIGAIALPRTPTNGAPPKFLLTGSQDRTIKRWEVPRTAGAKPRALYTQKAHDKDINAIDVSPNDALFATASQDRTVKIWSLDDGEPVGVLRGHKRGVWSVKFSHHEKVIATGSGDRTLKLWSLNDYSCLRTFEGHTNSVLKVAFMTAGLQLASAGGDGLVKVWTIKSGECATTLDNHDEKVWSLAVRNDDHVLVSGGADSRVNLWEDVSEIEREEDAKKAEELVEKEQTLANYLHRKDWRNAIVMAMSLDQPHRLLNLFKNVHESRGVDAPEADKQSITGLAAVDDVLASLAEEQVGTLMIRIRDWNTNARTAPVAQRILHVLLQSYPPETFLKIDGIKGALDALVPYSERHYGRIGELMKDSYIVEFTLRGMEDVLGLEEDEEEQTNGTAMEVDA